MSGPRRRLTRLGLRARVTFMVGLGALLLSVTMGCLSYFTVRHFLVNDQLSAANRQAYTIAAQVRNGLRSRTPVAAVVDALYTPSGSNSIVYSEGSWEAFYLGGKSSLPLGLRDLVLRGTPATQTYDLGGSPTVAIGIPLPAVNADFFAVVSLGDLSHTLRVLAITLTVVGVVTTVLGAAVGRWASGRSLRPLTAVSQAAAAIAGGRLDTRLSPSERDADLEGLARSFNLMVDQLQERIEREARFTSDVSHELRSPLTTLVTSLDVLEGESEPLSGRGRRALTLLADDIRRFQHLVGDLLEMSRTDAGSSDVFLEEVRAGELITFSVASHSRRGQGDVEPPEMDVPGAVAASIVRVDKRRFERVLANLLDNAAHYGGGATAVRARLVARPSGAPPTLQVAVEDRGPGVPASERTRIFERFYRGHASGQRGAGTGSGLGLALVAEHLQLLGGGAWVENNPGGGARFVVELPVVCDEEEQ